MNKNEMKNQVRIILASMDSQLEIYNRIFEDTDNDQILDDLESLTASLACLIQEDFDDSPVYVFNEAFVLLDTFNNLTIKLDA